MASLVGEGKLVIREVTGQKRELVLTGRSMPYSPANLGGLQQRKQVTHYPGNPVATTQIFGIEELPAELEGKWSDKFLTSSGKVLWDNYPLIRAEDVYDAMESLCLGLQLLSVNWAGRERWGFLDRIQPQWQTRADVHWNCSFSWVSRLESVDPPQVQALSEAGAKLEGIVDKAKELIAKGIELLRENYFEVMDDELISRLRDAEDAVKVAEAVASLGVEVGSGAIEVADRVMEGMYAAARSAFNVANQARAIAVVDGASYMGWNFGQGSRHLPPPASATRLSGTFSQGGLWNGEFGAGMTGADVSGEDGIGDQSMLDGGAGGSTPGSTPRAWHEADNSGMAYERLDPADPMVSAVAQNPAAYLRKQVDLDEATENILMAAFEYSQAAESIRVLVRPEAKTIHTSEKNQDLRHVAIKYYGSQDRWTELAELNDIDGSLPATGTRLVIPR